MDVVTFGGRVLLIVMLGSAVAGKLRSPSARAAVTDAVATLLRRTGPATTLLARTLLAVEAITVVLLAVPVTVQIGYAAAAVLLGALTLGTFVLARTGGVACPCFGRVGLPLAGHHVARNAALMVVAVTGWIADTGSHLAAPHVAAGALVGGFLGLLVVRWDDLAVLTGRSVMFTEGRPWHT